MVPALRDADLRAVRRGMRANTPRKAKLPRGFPARLSPSSSDSQRASLVGTELAPEPVMKRIRNSCQLLVGVACLVLGSEISACSDSVEAVDQFTDCMDICNRYADCIDSDYDVGKCEDRCRDKDFKNDNNVVDKCENCLDNKSCTNSVFACGAECSSIVP
jgi:hypothetical protein